MKNSRDRFKSRSDTADKKIFKQEEIFFENMQLENIQSEAFGRKRDIEE